MNREVLIQNIRFLCTQNNISISQLEKYINVSPGFLSRMASSYPSIDKIAAVAEYLDVSIDLLCNTILAEDNILYNTFAENLSKKTINRAIQWTALNNDSEYYSDINELDKIKFRRGITIDEDTDNEIEMLDQDLLVYMLSEENNVKIFFVYQKVGSDLSELIILNCHVYLYLIIYSNNKYNFIEADKKIVKELYDNIKTVLYKDPQKEHIKNIIENFIKKE